MEITYISLPTTPFSARNSKKSKGANIPLICDMSSDIFSKEVNVGQYDLIYAGAQKNLGPAGATVYIVKD